MRRRTEVITLTMLAGTAIILGGCLDDDQKPKLVKSQEECAKEFDDPEGCREAAEQALAAHEKTAPKFGTQQECEAEFGPERCRPVQHEGSAWFMPAMTGFIIGRMMDGSNSYRVQPACSNRNDVYTNGCGPVQGRAHSGYAGGASMLAGRYSGGAYTPDPSYTNSWTSGKVASSRAMAGPDAVARGGFGGSAVGEAGE